MALIGKDTGAAADCLKNSELVGIPTETVYGLAANALDHEAVLKIFKAKNRPFFDPLIVHVPDADKIKEYAVNVPEYALALAREYWPGPLTLILRKKDNIPDLVSSGADTVGLRVPDHELTLELLKMLDFPLAAPSANPFGYVSPTTALHVNAQLGQSVCYILDGGPCQVGVESTIVDCTNEVPVILRLGGLPVESIVRIAGPVQEEIKSGSNIKAPGQLDSHYSPGCLLNIGLPPSGTWLPDSAIIVFQKKVQGFPEEHQIVLSAEGNLEEAAVNLFASLRMLDEKGYKNAWAELVPDTGIGRAINDRLKRAAFR